MSDNDKTIYYTVDPSTNPSTWPGSGPSASGYIAVEKVDVIFVNINAGSDFRQLRTGTKHVHHALMQVAKHVSRGLYQLVSLNISDYSCVVVFSTEKQRSELLWKNGFPWDRDDDPQPEIILK
ncbi:hypothetical protein HJFPF1_12572 [Paramyrothecium foliicola]|nr:hypothetical protein HJFPF1_12572 [Paramyrothecium foliicola]